MAYSSGSYGYARARQATQPSRPAYSYSGTQSFRQADQRSTPPPPHTYGSVTGGQSAAAAYNSQNRPASGLPSWLQNAANTFKQTVQNVTGAIGNFAQQYQQAAQASAQRGPSFPPNSMYAAAQANPQEYARNMFGNASRFPQPGNLQNPNYSYGQQMNDYIRSKSYVFGQQAPPPHTYQDVTGGASAAAAYTYTQQQRARQAYADRLNAQAAEYFSRPVAPTTTPTNTGGGYGYGYGGYGYGGGGGGGGGGSPSGNFYNNLLNWRVLEVQGG